MPNVSPHLFSQFPGTPSFRRLLGTLSVVLLGGCAVPATEDAEESTAAFPLTANGANVALVVNNDWGAGYCASIKITNQTSQTAANWRVWLKLNGDRITSAWNYTGTTSDGTLAVTPPTWAASLTPGQVRSDAGFCATRSGSAGATVTNVQLFNASGNVIVGGGGTGTGTTTSTTTSTTSTTTSTTSTTTSTTSTTTSTTTTTTGTGGGCTATTTPVARHGQLRIENGKLLNQCGRQVQFASMSMYDWSQQGRQFYNAAAVKNLAGTGPGQKKLTTLRIPLLAKNWPADYGRVKTVMDACIANGIYCIPNWHVIGASDVAKAKAFYVQLAKDYGKTPNVIYEPWNEPTTQSWAEIKKYMEEIIAAVRPIDPDGIFLAGTRQWCQRPDEACADPINKPNVGYVFHFYANTHSLAGFQKNIDACLSRKQLVWTTEYGGVSADGNGTFNTTEVNKWWDYMDTKLISSNNWALETNTETSSVFVTNASSTGPWPDSQLTYSGKNVFAYIAERYPVTMSQ